MNRKGAKKTQRTQRQFGFARVESDPKSAIQNPKFRNGVTTNG